MNWSTRTLIIQNTKETDKDRVLVLPGAGRAYTYRPNWQYNGRVNSAIKILLQDTLLKVVVSGYHDGAEYAETSDLAASLIAGGIEQSRIIYDSSAHDTFQTIINLNRLNRNQTFIFVSQPEHLSRMLWMARTYGYSVNGIVAEGWPHGTPQWFKSRERMACVKARIEVYYKIITDKRLSFLSDE